MNAINFQVKPGDIIDFPYDTRTEVVKLISIFVLLIISIFIGLLPSCNKSCSRRVRFIGVTNVFTGGLFLSTALFLLFSQGGCLTFHFIKERSKAYLVPISAFISFFSFALLLFIEKVAFDSKVLQPFQQGTKNKKPSGTQKNKEEEKYIVSKESQNNKEKLVIKNEKEQDQEISLENNNGKNKILL